MESRNVLIAPDKFKGTLTSGQAAEAIARGLRRSRPGWHLVLRPIADGGEGTVDAMLSSDPSFNPKAVPTLDALLRPVTGRIICRGPTALFESATAIGLARQHPSECDPWRASTRGVGLLLKSAAARGADRIVVGLGGSATNDGGLGLAAELGWRFLDEAAKEVDPLPLNFSRIRKIVRPSWRLPGEVLGLCDVTNPLLGPEGASFTYGPQKGLRDPGNMDRALAGVADLVAAETGLDFRNRAGAGAAGGLGYGLLTFCAGRLTPGFKFIADMTGIEAAVQNSDLVITGEGKLDRQTLSGKGPAELACLARTHGQKVVAFCGVAETEEGHQQLFDHIIPIASGRYTLARALQEPAAALEEAAYTFASAQGDSTTL